MRLILQEYVFAILSSYAKTRCICMQHIDLMRGVACMLVGTMWPHTCCRNTWRTWAACACVPHRWDPCSGIEQRAARIPKNIHHVPCPGGFGLLACLNFSWQSAAVARDQHQRGSNTQRINWDEFTHKERFLFFLGESGCAWFWIDFEFWIHWLDFIAKVFACEAECAILSKTWPTSIQNSHANLSNLNVSQPQFSLSRHFPITLFPSAP